MLIQTAVTFLNYFSAKWKKRQSVTGWISLAQTSGLFNTCGHIPSCLDWMPCQRFKSFAWSVIFSWHGDDVSCIICCHLRDNYAPERGAEKQRALFPRAAVMRSWLKCDADIHSCCWAAPYVLMYSDGPETLWLLCFFKHISLDLSLFSLSQLWKPPAVTHLTPSVCGEAHSHNHRKQDVAKKVP